MKANHLPTTEETAGWVKPTQDPAVQLERAIRFVEKATGCALRPYKAETVRILGRGEKLNLRPLPVLSWSANGFQRSTEIKAWDGAEGENKIEHEGGYAPGKLPAILKELVVLLIKTMAGDREAKEEARELLKIARATDDETNREGPG